MVQSGVGVDGPAELCQWHSMYPIMPQKHVFDTVDTGPIIVECEVSAVTLMSCVLLRTVVPLTAPSPLLLFSQLETWSFNQCLCLALCQVVWIIFYTALHFD